MHDGNIRRPHAILASLKHSGGFFNSELVMEDAALLAEACSNILHKLERAGLVLSEVDRVVGPAMGAITIAHEIARQISEGTGHRCLRAYPIKVDDRTDHKTMRFDKTTIKKGERVLGCEDVSTTKKSIMLAMDAVTSLGGIILPFTAMLVNRSGFDDVNGSKIIALITQHLPTWEAEECPLCKAGSEAIAEVKKPANWARLTAAY